MSAPTVAQFQAEMRRVIESETPGAQAVAYMLSAFTGGRGMETAEIALQAVQAGLERTDSISSLILKLRISFAELCLRRRRLDVLREALLRPHHSFVSDGRVDASAWLRVLCSTGDPAKEESLFRLAHRHLRDQAVEAYEIALVVDPQHPDIAALSLEFPAAGAVLGELLMRDRIAAASRLPAASPPCQPATAPASSPTKPRRLL